MLTKKLKNKKQSKLTTKQKNKTNQLKHSLLAELLTEPNIFLIYASAENSTTYKWRNMHDKLSLKASRHPMIC